MRAVVLVGGFGTRLRPLTDSIPKQMLTVGDRPMIEQAVGNLARHGVTEVVFSLGFKPEAFEMAYPDGICAGVDVRYVIEPEPLDTGGAIGLAARCAGIDDTFLACNGDVLTDLNIGALLVRHKEVGATATIALVRVDDPGSYGVAAVGGDGRVLRFLEKPSTTEGCANLVNAGTYVFEPSVLERIPAGRPVSVEREVFPAMVDQGVLFGMASDCYWVDAGTPETYLAANLDLLENSEGRIHPDAFVDPEALVVGSVVESGTFVASGASLEGSLVMAGARVGENARIIGSIVGPEADVEADATVAGLSVLGFGASVKRGEQLDGVLRPEPGG